MWSKIIFPTGLGTAQRDAAHWKKLTQTVCSNNLNRADAVLSRANPQDLDLLVLPELAFSGMYIVCSEGHCASSLLEAESLVACLFAAALPSSPTFQHLP